MKYEMKTLLEILDKMNDENANLKEEIRKMKLQISEGRGKTSEKRYELLDED